MSAKIWWPDHLPVPDVDEFVHGKWRGDCGYCYVGWCGVAFGESPNPRDWRGWPYNPPLDSFLRASIHEATGQYAPRWWDLGDLASAMSDLYEWGVRAHAKKKPLRLRAAYYRRDSKTHLTKKAARRLWCRVAEQHGYDASSPSGVWTRSRYAPTWPGNAGY